MWDGTAIHMFGAKNEVVNTVLLLEASASAATNMTVTFDTLTGPGGAQIHAAPTTGLGVYQWTERPIELFYVRYLPVQGLSHFGYNASYDERHVPSKLRRPYTGAGVGSGGWTDRPAHDQHFPDIAVPLEWVPTFDIAPAKSQAVWIDLYIPRNATPGAYQGLIDIRENGVLTRQVPIALQIYPFALPDTPSAHTMLFIQYGDINERYLGNRWPDVGPQGDASNDIIDRHFALAHRHKLALIDANDGPEVWNTDAPRPRWEPRLDGSLFNTAHGYDGPGQNVGNGVFSIGTYNTWYGGNWDSQSEMWSHTNAWADWFSAHSPNTERFLYLIDESSDYAQTQTWASWMDTNPGSGKNLPSFATIGFPDARANVPALDIPTSTLYLGITADWETALAAYNADATKRAFFYNGGRPGEGSFMTDDDGVALRVNGWTQFKKGFKRWFYWNGTYYYDQQACGDRVNLFASAKTYGCDSGTDASYGHTGFQYSNGDGVMFYPGTDTMYPADSYNEAGPIASLRLKYWRRGVQDHDYLTLAAAKNPAAVAALVQQMIPKVVWENGVDNPSDPTYVHADISWPIDPDAWEDAREQLANIIAQ